MGKYVKKPVAIEAMQWVPYVSKSAEEVRDWLNEPSGPKWETVGYGMECNILISTLEGVMVARPNDWIIKGVKGEFYPCKPDIFAETYEALEF